MEAKHNSLKEVPKYFAKSKRQMEKDIIRYFYNKEQTDKIVQGEFYMLLKEMQGYIDRLVVEQEQALVDDFNIVENTIYLNDYKKKIFYDDEAKWIFISDMNSKDFRKMVDERNS
ncbi:MAG: hypothetical protein PF569_10370 [Candidatus Woesearchaeota archaeon]|nr:hypothetical protein [Candidatus Woesearchaeota archaeon]